MVAGGAKAPKVEGVLIPSPNMEVGLMATEGAFVLDVCPKLKPPKGLGGCCAAEKPK